MPYGHPEFGKAFACHACDGSESPLMRAERLWRISGISQREQGGCTFAQFDAALNPEMQPALEAACRWAIDDGPPFLVLCGPVGRGKTHLAIAAARVCIDRGEAVAYHVVPRLLDDLRATQRPLSEHESPPKSLADVRRKAERYPAVILDDLGANKTTEWADEQLFSVINERYRDARRTIITSNVSAASFDARLRSRILDVSLSRVVVCQGNDVRAVPRD